MTATPVFLGDPLDTPVLRTGWTVQSTATGSDQNLTASIGVPLDEAAAFAEALNLGREMAMAKRDET